MPSSTKSSVALTEVPLSTPPTTGPTVRIPAWVAPVAAAAVVAIYVFGVARAGAGAGSLMLVAAGAAFGWTARTLWLTLQPLSTDHLDVGDQTIAHGRRRRELEREKQLVIKALKELEFDRDMGKIGAADYENIAGRFRARARRILQELEGTGDVREMIERELRSRLGADAPVKAAPAAAAATRACIACETQNDPDATFCKRCGARLEGAS